MILVFNITGALCAGIAIAVLVLLGRVFPGTTQMQDFIAAGLVTSIVGDIAERLGMRPRIFFVSLRLWGVVIGLIGVAQWSPAAAMALGLVVATVYIVLNGRHSETKRWEAAVESLRQYKLVTDLDNGQLRGVLLYDALFENLWLRSTDAMRRHTADVLGRLGGDPAVAIDGQERIAIGSLQQQLETTFVTGVAPWRLPGIGMLRTRLKRLAG